MKNHSWDMVSDSCRRMSALTCARLQYESPKGVQNVEIMNPGPAHERPTSLRPLVTAPKPESSALGDCRQDKLTRKQTDLKDLPFSSKTSHSSGMFNMSALNVTTSLQLSKRGFELKETNRQIPSKNNHAFEVHQNILCIKTFEGHLVKCESETMNPRVLLHMRAPNIACKPNA